MFIPFEELSPNARVWIYQLDRKIDEQDRKTIEDAVKKFCNQWEAHGAPLKTSYQIAHNHFLVLAVDEDVASASGCSIDGSVRVLKEIGARLNLNFFDRTLAAFLINDSVVTYPIAELKELFSSGTLNSSVLAFDNLVASKAMYLKNWKVPVNQSWLAKYLPKGALA